MGFVKKIKKMFAGGGNVGAFLFSFSVGLTAEDCCAGLLGTKTAETKCLVSAPVGSHLKSCAADQHFC